MTSSVLLAFLHHAAAFLLVAAVLVELVLLRGELSAAVAHSIVRVDALYGLSALAVLVVGFLRVVYTEKGAAYYFHSAPFVAKIVLFAIVGLISIYPTLQFVGWRKTLRQGRIPPLDERRRRTLGRLVHLELGLLFVIMLCAALMARGVGTFG